MLTEQDPVDIRTDKQGSDSPTNSSLAGTIFIAPNIDRKKPIAIDPSAKWDSCL